ncbi:MAG: hypothetical protein WBW99_02180, partial [Pseudolabrys sp.]
PAIDALHATARDMEVFRRDGGLAHRDSGRLQEVAVRNVYMIFIDKLLVRAATVSAPLTNFQINGLFKARWYLSPPFGESPVWAHAPWLST